MEQITLYYREGPSDKIYQASLQSRDGGYVVDFAYGRRGSTLNAGTKTESPVDYQSAKRIYDKLVREKTAKGYTPGEPGTPYQQTVKEQQTTGILPQLLNPVSDNQVESLLDDRDYWMQEKMDGRRLLLKKENGQITGINRLGLIVALPDTLIRSAKNYPRDFLFDGEAIGDTLHVFDVLSLGREDLRRKRFAVRCMRLRDCLEAFDHPHIRLVETFVATEKRSRFNGFRLNGKEGVVFKHVDAPYTPGRPNAGGSQLKFKFYETASFIVAKPNGIRSVSLLLFEGDKIRPAGNVTIPPNHDVPSAGDIVEVRYLYAFAESGCIYQPAYLGRRDDIPREDCTVDQLKFKAASAA